AANLSPARFLSELTASINVMRSVVPAGINVVGFGSGAGCGSAFGWSTAGAFTGASAGLLTESALVVDGALLHEARARPSEQTTTALKLRFIVLLLPAAPEPSQCALALRSLLFFLCALGQGFSFQFLSQPRTNPWSGRVRFKDVVNRCVFDSHIPYFLIPTN